MEKSTTIHEKKLLRCWLRNPSSFEDIFQLITQSFVYSCYIMYCHLCKQTKNYDFIIDLFCFRFSAPNRKANKIVSYEVANYGSDS